MDRVLPFRAKPKAIHETTRNNANQRGLNLGSGLRLCDSRFSLADANIITTPVKVIGLNYERVMQDLCTRSVLTAEILGSSIRAMGLKRAEVEDG